MSLAADFEQLLESLPPDWTDIEVDLSISDETRFVDTAVSLSLVNAQPYSGSSMRWKVPIAHTFGHAAAPQSVLGVLRELDRSGVAGEIRLLQTREGRAEVVQMWGRPESVRREFRRRRTL